MNPLVHVNQTYFFLDPDYYKRKLGTIIGIKISLNAPVKKITNRSKAVLLFATSLFYPFLSELAFCIIFICSWKAWGLFDWVLLYFDFCSVYSG